MIPGGGAEGVIVANADFIGGFALWVDESGRLHHTYSFLGVETYKQTSTEPLPTGEVTVKMLFEADENKPGTGGNVTLWADDQQIGEGHGSDRAGRVLLIRRHGHRPRQRPGGRPRLRTQGTVRVHRHGQAGRLRPQTDPQTKRWPCTPTPQSKPLGKAPPVDARRQITDDEFYFATTTLVVNSVEVAIAARHTEGSSRQCWYQAARWCARW